MQKGFVKVGVVSPKIKVCDVEFNVNGILTAIDQAEQNNVNLIAFPELSICGYTAGDLIYSDVILSACKKALLKIAEYTLDKNLIAYVGLPLMVEDLLYNVSACVGNGKVLGIVPKSYLPNYNEFYEKRYFAPADNKLRFIDLDIQNQEFCNVPFGTNIIYTDKYDQSFKVACELCEDLWTPVPPSISHAVNGAKIIVNLSASSENSCKPSVRRNLVKEHSSKIVSAYVYANAGEGESTTDCVFSGHNIIAENGEILAENTPFENNMITADIDLDGIGYQRSKAFNQVFGVKKQEYHVVNFTIDTSKGETERTYNKNPFIVKGEEEFLLDIQSAGLRKRIEHTNAQKIVLGLSGGLDSTLALIVAVRAMKQLNRPLKDILTVTMPCFGTSSRTFENSIKLAKAYGVTLEKIDIGKTVKRHLKDISHPEDVHDPAYENAQARERTQVLMDLANMYNGFVVGTGDLSELALGFATYNGDHMSMYGVNGSVPKTLVRHLVRYEANNSKGKLKWVLEDVLDTPVSPELLPAKNDKINQVTEDIVGPYVLHDFFLYYFVKCGFSPEKIYYSAVRTFKGEFNEQIILKWLKIFFRRFFNQQFKRSCMPDGVKVTEISLSPRGSFKMPSDAISKLWLEQLENL
ncbi:MAG: NAD(+) synthase [Clostridia bacterium]|nr:NAD(+) synthase [Clostridia bacterium]